MTAGEGGGLRFDATAALVAVVLVVLVGRLAQIQLLSGSEYRDIADGNRIRLIETPAPRGRLVDRQGRVLAGTRPSHDLTLDWVGLFDLSPEDRRDVFRRVTDELDHFGVTLEADRLEDTFLRARRQALEPVTVHRDLGTDAWIALSEIHLPGFETASVPRRTYPQGDTAAHLVGIVGSVVDDAEADRLNRVDPGHGYRPGSEIGRSGLEELFERHLRGVPELRRVEVDSANRVVRTISIDRPARPGFDIHLEVDLDLQILAERALADELDRLRGIGRPVSGAAFVVLDPVTGAVPALVSAPSFDPTLFVDGLDTARAGELFADPSEPFLNRVVDGRYPPGSTFKPVTALVAQSTGVRPAASIWYDEGSHQLAGCTEAAGSRCRFRNAGGVVLGAVNLPEALAVSSDTYFYSIGELLWQRRAEHGDDPTQQVAAALGLGAPTGIELPGEDAGRLPSPAGRREAHDVDPGAVPDPQWYTGDNVNLAIGQGGLLVTPIQLAALYGALANGGARVQPRLAHHVVDGRTGEIVVAFDPRTVPGQPLPDDHLIPIVEGLLAAPRRGTAAPAFAGFDLEAFPVAGKTGTAEVRGKEDFSLFAGFAPWPRPRYAFAVIIEEGGFGGDAAAPVARRFLDAVATGPRWAGDRP